MVELLAPAGSLEALRMAVACGADAVYLGGTAFNARASASNFTTEQLSEAFEYCHTRNVKAYVTLNTLLNDSELLPAYTAACDMARLGADAFIVQDLGLIGLLSENTDFELHASTQMSLHNVDGVRAAQKLGCSRIVLARETPLADIAQIKKRTGAEVEVFIHGALCISFSGQCLFSSLAGGRSGNRGQCAQACRLPYGLLRDGKEIDKGYLLSPKDLCTIDYLADIIACGADSLKIEGRLKRPEYVGIVTKQYREAIDLLSEARDYDGEKLTKELMKIFNRGGFTKGYYTGEKNIVYSAAPNNMGVKIGTVQSADGRNIIAQVPLSKGDGVEIRRSCVSLGGGAVYELASAGRQVKCAAGELKINSLGSDCVGAEIYRTTDSEQVKEINAYALSASRIRLDIMLLQTQTELILSVKDKCAEVQASCVYEFVKGKTSDGDIAAALCKLGGTQYYAGGIEVRRPPEGYIPQGMLNALRREAIKRLDKAKINSGKRAAYVRAEDVPQKSEDCGLKSTRGSAVFAYTQEELTLLCMAGNANRIYFKPYDYSCVKNVTLPEGKRPQVYFVPFDFAFADDFHFYTELDMFDGIYAENLYAVEMAERLKMPCVGGAGLNVLNGCSARVLLKLGCAIVTVSPEANSGQIKGIAKCGACELIVSGRLPVMKLVYCLRRFARSAGCVNCSGCFELKDRKGYRFEDVVFKVSQCRHILLNSANLNLISEARTLPVSVCCLNNSACGAETTKGHYNRGV